MKLLTDTHQSKISCELGCYDRLILTGTLPEQSYSQGITSYLNAHEVRIFDYAQFAEPFKAFIRSNAEQIGKDSGIEIEFVRKSHIRKESIISAKIEKRGNAPGLVHILSAMESCNTFKPWYDKISGKTFLKPDQSKCLHYYFYFIDEYAGLCYVRVPTWCPYRLQVYVNGHNLLASELKQANIHFTMIDNAFDSLENAQKAQELSDALSIEKLHRRLEEFAGRFCPVYKELGLRYHWSVMQVAYATDIVFRNQEDLQRIYSELVATAIHTVKPENIATFLGQKLDPRYQGEIGNNYNIRIEGSRIKHSMGSCSIKMYDKFSKILRIETTANDISFFKHFREVVHRDGTAPNQTAPLKKNIYSLAFLSDNLKAANRRYLEFISSFDNKEVEHDRIEKVTQPKEANNRKYKGFNFFNEEDIQILLTILRGEFNINGLRNKDMRKALGLSGTKTSRLLKRLWTHGLIKKIGNTYKYYVTKLGKETIITAQKIKELVLVPAFCY